SRAAPVSSFMLDAGICGEPGSCFHRVSPVTGSRTTPVNWASLGLANGLVSALASPAGVGALSEADMGTICGVASPTVGSGMLDACEVGTPVDPDGPLPDCWLPVSLGQYNRSAAA